MRGGGQISTYATSDNKIATWGDIKSNYTDASAFSDNKCMTKSQILNTSHTRFNIPSIDGASNYSDNQLVPLSKISYGGIVLNIFRITSAYIYTGSGSSYNEVESVNFTTIGTSSASIRVPTSGETLVIKGLTGAYDNTTRVSVKTGQSLLTTSFIKPGQGQGEGDLVIDKPGSNFYAIIPSNFYVVGSQITLTATKTGNESRTSTAKLTIGSTDQSDDIYPAQYKAAVYEQTSNSGGLIKYNWRTIYSSTNFSQSGSAYTLTIPNSELTEGGNGVITSNFIYIGKLVNGDAVKIRVTGDNSSTCKFGLKDPVGNNEITMFNTAYFTAPGYNSTSSTRTFNYTVEALSSTNRVLDTITIKLVITA